ncbi:serine hydrolase [Lutibacter flavus]|uniref:beta-lactamase n=1 Tax=Lutibacter flavus TaxID=691689 RepID=A0A238VCK3_9FLAO|nr:serine hydrolase [Lutibacter flavus]SNR32122.1 beta-lactamase class A [Lutibacter flavus]
MKTYQLFIVLLYFFSFPILAQNELPIQQNNLNLKPLNSLSSSSLQTNLEKELNLIPKWKTLMSQNKMAVGVIDLSNPKIAKYASINGNHMMYAASLPKISILLAAMDAIENGELIETKEVTNDMKLMISKSDNHAATRMIDRLGYAKIASVMTSEKYELYDEEDGGGLWVGKRYGGGGDTNREPLLNLSHAATVNQVCRYYYLLANGKLVSSDRSKQMLDILENPALHHKFVNTLDQIAPNARLFRKSGSWRNFHSDSILVWGKDPKRRYILVALIEDESGEQIIRSLVRPIEKALKKA